MAYPTLDDEKLFLRITPSPSWEDQSLDTLITTLLAAAVEHVETIVGDLSTDTPERVNLAIKFLAAFWFEHPEADDKSVDAAYKAVKLLVSSYIDFDFAVPTTP